MLILGVDTSGKNGSIALVKFGDENALTFEVVSLQGGTFSAQLVPQISELLSRHKFTKLDLDGFAVVSGPGSFTGLRVGLAAIKALAEVLQRPVAAVSLLEAIARESRKRGKVIALLDAGRAEVYAGEFSMNETEVEVGPQRLVALIELSALSDGPEIVTTDSKIAAFARERRWHVTQIEYPKSDYIARLGFEKINAGVVTSVDALDANYIRRSDAEIKFAGH
ncbi:MAG TPA: tRNA (adenosine(37)-N6)-threonylcarbamoyltransferase complex dimerization subunit type 1 TsaB [Terriglobales bacterium]|jgi:tRNA threonylcarbamoyladenosine biosynthesis protein TsaB